MELEKFIRQCNCLAFDLLLWCAAASTPCRQHFACKAKCNINKPGPKTKRNMSTCHTKHKLPLGPGQPPDIERRTWYTGTQNFSWWTRNTPRNFKLNYVQSPVPKAGTDKTFENAQMWVYWTTQSEECGQHHMDERSAEWNGGVMVVGLPNCWEFSLHAAWP